MSGNVWEMVRDCGNKSYEGAPADGSAWETGDCAYRVFRGGAWNDGSHRVRSAYRNRNTSGSRDLSWGFRLVQDR